MNKNRFVMMAAVSLLASAFMAPVYADSTCKDGTTSTITGKGACSHHGGVLKTPAASPAAAAPASVPAKAAAPAPAVKAAAPAAAASGEAPSGATAKCKDGSYSMSKHHQGSCSHHGGVASFLDAK